MARTPRTATVEPPPVLPPDVDIVTDAMLATAEQAAELAAEKLAEEDGKRGRDGKRARGRNLTLTELERTARRATAELARLRDARAAQEQVRSARGPAEEAARPIVAEMAERLETSRRAVTAAIIDAEQALQRLVETAQAHDGQVRQVSAELAGRGLLAVDAFGDHETGGTADGRSVRLDGASWSSLDASGLFCWSVAAVASWAWGDAHPVAWYRRDFRVVSATQRAAAVLADVPDLPPRAPSVTMPPLPGLRALKG